MIPGFLVGSFNASSCKSSTLSGISTDVIRNDMISEALEIFVFEASNAPQAASSVGSRRSCLGIKIKC